MSRRSVTLLVAAAGVLIALAVAVVAPVPYVALTPGPTLNTLGSLSGKPLIQVKGHRTYPDHGQPQHGDGVLHRRAGNPFQHFRGAPLLAEPA